MCREPSLPSPNSPSDRPRAFVRLGLSLALVGAVWWPARSGGDDGFPLSTYPMFAHVRSPTSKVSTVLGVHADGRRTPLTPWLVGGTEVKNQALSTVLRAIANGRGGALCDEVAARVAASSPDASMRALEVVTDTWDVLEFTRSGATPRRRVVHAHCEVPR